VRLMRRLYGASGPIPGIPSQRPSSIRKPLALSSRWSSACATATVAALVLLVSGPNPIEAQGSLSGHWVGSGEGRRMGGDSWAAAVFSYRSSFLFNVDAAGRVTGDAVVIYDLQLDDSRLRSYLAVMNNTVTAGTLGALPGLVGTLIAPGASVTETLGLRMSYDEPVPVRRGQITGSLRDGTLHLDWVARPKDVPYTWFRVMTTKDEKIKSAAASAFRPWLDDGHVDNMNGMAYAISVGNRKSASGSDGGYWTAHRVE